MNNNYKWNGVAFNSKGIVIEVTPVVPKAEHSFQKYEIPGRSDFLTIDDKKYKPIPFSLECHFNESNVDTNDIRSWLDGYGTLQLDDEKIYTGYISNSIPFEKVVGFQKFIIQFMLQPIAKSLTATTVSSTNSTTFNSTTYTNSYPTITITTIGDTTITLNDVSFTIYGASGTYVLDCGAKVITKNSVNQSQNMSGSFPYVKPGSNELTVNGNVSALSIQYYKTYL